MSTITPISIPISQPDRVDWTDAESIEELNTKLSLNWTKSDEMFQILFDSLRNAINAINTVFAGLGNQPTSKTFVLFNGSNEDGVDGDWGPPGPRGDRGLQGIQGSVGIPGEDGRDGDTGAPVPFNLPPINIGSVLTGFTTGSIPFARATGILTQDNSNIFWDNTTKTLKINGAGTVANSIQLGTGGNRLTITTGTVSTNFDAASLITFFTAAGMQINSSGVVKIHDSGGSVGSCRFGVLGQNNEHVVRFVGDSTAGQSLGPRISAGTNSSDNAFRVLTQSEGAELFFIRGDGNVGIGLVGVNVTARIHIKAGTAAASTAPLKFNSGTVLTTAEAGAVEFNTDDFFATITTGAARKAFILDDGSRLTSGKIPIATTNGRLIDLTASSAYTPTNVTTDRSYDANATSIDELADVLGTVIADLQTKGILG